MAVFDISDVQPIPQPRLADPEVLRDLSDRSLTLTGHGHHIVAELSWMGSRLDGLSAWSTSFQQDLTAPQIECHLLMQQSRSKLTNPG